MNPEPSPVALVTGAGSGMGRSCVDTFLERGWTVLALDLSTDGLHHRHAELIPESVDVTDRTAVDAVIDQHIAGIGGQLDAVVNAAGIYPPSTLESFTTELYRKVFDVNVLGVLNVMAAAAPHLRAGSGIVNFASVDGYAVSPGQLVYGASKAAVIMLTKATALELAPRGIRVNAVAPGWVSTPGTAATERMAEAAASIPLGRVAQPAEIAEWVWLLTGSGSADYVTGETVTIAGGSVLR